MWVQTHFFTSFGDKKYPVNYYKTYKIKTTDPANFSVALSEKY